MTSANAHTSTERGRKTLIEKVVSDIEVGSQQFPDHIRTKVCSVQYTLKNVAVLQPQFASSPVSLAMEWVAISIFFFSLLVFQIALFYQSLLRHVTGALDRCMICVFEFHRTFACSAPQRSTTLENASNHACNCSQLLARRDGVCFFWYRI